MKILCENLWLVEADFLCITTNGDVNKDGFAVMGRGCARECKERFPGVDRDLGDKLATYGNHVHPIAMWGTQELLSFPTKNHWWEKSDPRLISQSCRELKQLLASRGRNRATVVLPRPGCNNGQLDWYKDVRPILLRYFWNSPNILVVHKMDTIVYNKAQPNYEEP